MFYRRNIDFPEPKEYLEVYPAPYNKKGLEGDFYVDGRPPAGSLADIRQAFPDATLRIHLGNEIIENEPIEGMKIVRRLPDDKKIIQAIKEGVKSATYLLPWTSTGLKLGAYPTDESINAEFQLSQKVFLQHLNNELREAEEKHSQAVDMLKRKKEFDPYSGRHVSEWEALFQNKAKVLRNVIAFLSKFSAEDYVAYVYSQMLLNNIAILKSVGFQTFNTRFLDRVLKGEMPKSIWDEHLNMFKKFVPKSKWKKSIKLFEKHIHEWALQHYVGTIYEMVCTDVEPKKVIDDIIKLWAGIPNFKAALLKELQKKNAFDYWTLTCAHTIFEHKGAPSTEFFRERLEYLKRVIAPKFGQICPAAAEDLIQEAERWVDELKNIYKLH